MFFFGKRQPPVRVTVKDGRFHFSAQGGNGNGGRASILQSLPERPVSKARRPRHVLVVEDSLDGVHALVLLLRDMGHTVDYAINGYSALDLIKSCRPEIVLLDLNLPGLSGFEVCRRIKADPKLKQVRFVALTAFGQEAYRESAEDAGCERYFVKPIAIPELEELLETL